jgi:hypothetical protein
MTTADQAGLGDPSTASPIAGAPPGAPTGLTGSAGNGGVSITSYRRAH